MGDVSMLPSSHFDGSWAADAMNVFGDPSLAAGLDLMVGTIGSFPPTLADVAPTASGGSGKWKRGGSGSRNLDFGGYGADDSAMMDDGFMGRGKGGGSGAGSPMAADLHHEGTGNKRRLIWSQELHDRFLAAIKKLGVKNAVPKAILTLMDVEVRNPWFCFDHIDRTEEIDSVNWTIYYARI